jgi:hypothetical protein
MTTRKLAFTALSAAIVLGATSGTWAASKKSSMDPRVAYLSQKKGSDVTWCDVDPNCNGWAKWADLVRAGKVKAEERGLVGAASAP